MVYNSTGQDNMETIEEASMSGRQLAEEERQQRGNRRTGLITYRRQNNTSS